MEVLAAGEELVLVVVVVVVLVRAAWLTEEAAIWEALDLW